MLLEQIAAFKSILEKQKAKNPNAEGIAFYEKHVQVLILSYKYMIDGTRALDHNSLLKDQVRFLSRELKRSKDFEDNIKSILTLKANGQLEEMIQLADALVTRNINLYQSINTPIDGLGID